MALVRKGLRQCRRWPDATTGDGPAARVGSRALIVLDGGMSDERTATVEHNQPPFPG
jgi:hypothetical protein